MAVVDLPVVLPFPEETLLDEISKYVFTSKYARYLPDLKRRETWDEAVDRVEAMHLRKFDGVLEQQYIDEIRWAFDLVRDKRVAPSMRSMQFGGPAVEAHNARIYNCAVRHIDSIRAFSEVFYLLLCGCGVGLGLSQKFLHRLPDLVQASNRTGIVQTYVIEDSIEGWADSIEALLNCYFVNTAYTGRKIVFDYSRIRPAGSPLKTGGGKAPGHEGLKLAHRLIKNLLDRVIETEGVTRLRSIDAYDILMHTADAVLSGGVRRSATSVIFDKDDDDMMNAKTGNWNETNPQRGRSNNSVLLLRDETTPEEFEQIIERTREWGEPGFVFADNADTLYNPCFEVSFIPMTDDGVCGVQFCNLTTINGAKAFSKQDFVDCAKAAAIIGTLQATYTEFPYLSHVAKELTVSESLLGVSITAMMENPDVLLNAEYQQEAAAVVVDTNRIWAALCGIPQAARCNVIKPEGTSTLAFGSMFSGIHGAEGRWMFRLVQANKLDNVYRFLKSINPHLTEESVWSANGTDDVIYFPIKVSDSGLLKRDLTAIDHLDIIKSTQANWVLPGTTEANLKPVHHNVSCTVIVKDDEWDGVTSYLHDNRHSFAAVSLLSDTGGKKYAQAPMQSVDTAEEFEKFAYLVNNLIPIDYTLMIEEEDGTELMQEASCVGMACEVR